MLKMDLFSIQRFLRDAQAASSASAAEGRGGASGGHPPHAQPPPYHPALHPAYFSKLGLWFPPPPPLPSTPTHAHPHSHGGPSPSPSQHPGLPPVSGSSPHSHSHSHGHSHSHNAHPHPHTHPSTTPANGSSSSHHSRGSPRSLNCPLCGIHLDEVNIKQHFYEEVHKVETLRKINSYSNSGPKEGLRSPRDHFGGPPMDHDAAHPHGFFSPLSPSKKMSSSRWETYQRVKQNRHARLTALVRSTRRRFDHEVEEAERHVHHPLLHHPHTHAGHHAHSGPPPQSPHLHHPLATHAPRASTAMAAGGVFFPRAHMAVPPPAPLPGIVPPTSSHVTSESNGGRGAGGPSWNFNSEFAKFAANNGNLFSEKMDAMRLNKGLNDLTQANVASANGHHNQQRAREATSNYNLFGVNGGGKSGFHPHTHSTPSPSMSSSAASGAHSLSSPISNATHPLSGGGGGDGSMREAEEQRRRPRPEHDDDDDEEEENIVVDDEEDHERNVSNSSGNINNTSFTGVRSPAPRSTPASTPTHSRSTPPTPNSPLTTATPQQQQPTLAFKFRLVKEATANNNTSSSSSSSSNSTSKEETVTV